MNEMANLAEHFQADIELVRKGIGADQRIGYDFIYPGCGYGGSCFPKDVKALCAAAKAVGGTTAILSAVEAVNQAQKRRLLDKIDAYYGDAVAGKTFAVWGLAFKANTNDMREAPSREVLEGLWARGARVRAFDPEAMDECRRLYGERPDLRLCANQQEALSEANALVVVTDWTSFKAPDFNLLRQELADALVFDGRNLYEPSLMARYGLRYYAIGRPLV
jgi:UDPglucose 6-dehydrogenase